MSEQETAGPGQAGGASPVTWWQSLSSASKLRAGAIALIVVVVVVAAVVRLGDDGLTDRQRSLRDIAGLVCGVNPSTIAPPERWTMDRITADEGYVDIPVEGSSLVAGVLWRGRWEDPESASSLGCYEDPDGAPFRYASLEWQPFQHAYAHHFE